MRAPTVEPQVIASVVDRVLNLILRLPKKGTADFARLLLAAVKPKAGDKSAYEAALHAGFTRLDLIPHLPHRQALVDEMQAALVRT